MPCFNNRYHSILDKKYANIGTRRGLCGAFSHSFRPFSKGLGHLGAYPNRDDHFLGQALEVTLYQGAAQFASIWKVTLLKHRQKEMAW
jgi:hypothetical protein